MLMKDIEVGGVYVAKVNNVLTKVKVDAIRKASGVTRYDVTNLKTNRKTVFASAAKFRSPVEEKVDAKAVKSDDSGEQATRENDGSDQLDRKPTKPSSSSPASQVNGSTVPAKQSHVSGLAAKLSAATTVGQQPPHIVVEAYAGSGKTFTQIVGVAWAFGHKIWDKIQRRIGENINTKAGYQKVNLETFQIIPSPEQQKVWDSFALSRGQVKTVTYCAFNKSIVTEFGQEWGWLVKMLQEECSITLAFATVNGLGAKVCNTSYGRVECIDWHTENLVGKHLKKDPRELKRNPSEALMLKAVCDLVGLCKLTLCNGASYEDLENLCNHFEIELNGSKAKVFELVPIILDNSRDPATNKSMDWNDQNWLPVVNNLPVPQVDLLLCDEGQDLPRCKQEFIRKMGRRIVLVGDINQAIYGFAGADVDSIPRMTTLLKEDARGCETLRLTQTRRCGKAIVAEAQRIVKDFTAHESNPEGKISRIKLEKLITSANDGDMVLCRVNAPLVSQSLRMIKSGKKAIIRGRDFGKSLVSFVQKQDAVDVVDLTDKVCKWFNSETAKENAKPNPSDMKLLGFQDKYECVLAFTEGAFTVEDVIEKMELVFAGKVCSKCGKHYLETVEQCYPCQLPLVRPEGVIFSSIHRAKGLEADRVFMLDLKGCTMPHPMAKTDWAKRQEWNCRYIEITRAIEELIYVTDLRHRGVE